MKDLPEFCYTVLPTGEFAMLHRGHPGYCPIDISLAGAPNIRDLADKLNYQFGVTKEQEADMLAEALSEQNAPAEAIIEQQEFTL